jgi:cell division transport system permease protein
VTWFLDLVKGDSSAERVVPPSGFTAVLTMAAAAAMAFLAVFILALALSAGRQAAQWEGALADAATVRISAPAGLAEVQADAVETILAQTPGVGTTKRLTDQEQADLLAPWFGPDLPVETLRLPILIEVTFTEEGPDLAGLRQRFAAEAPGAVIDDHGRWRAPMIDAAKSLRSLSLVALGLIAAVTGVTVALAASAALAANGQVIDVLRLVGAEDAYIIRAFTRRFTLRALAGAAAGTLLGLVAVALIPTVAASGIAADVGFRGFGWLTPILVPLVGAALAFLATRVAAARRLNAGR